LTRFADNRDIFSPSITVERSTGTIVGFSNVPAGAIGQLVMNAPLAEVDGLGQISETAFISNGAGGYGASLTQTLLPTGGTLTTASTVAAACNCTTTGGWTTSVSIPF
jgi:hypothetical protein